MNNNQYNERCHNRKKQMYRLILGIQQLISYPVINTVWILFVVGVAFLVKTERKLVFALEIPFLLESVFSGCVQFIVIFIPALSAIGIIQLIGHIIATKDEADMNIVFEDKKEIKIHTPILIYKKYNKKSGVTMREFYSEIPMVKWQEKKEAICDRMNIHIIGDITYGGRKKNKGYKIYFESVKGRKPKERGILYDEIF